MPTWTETRAYLSSRYHLARVEDRTVELAWSFPATRELQLQTVEARTAAGRPALVIWCDTGLVSLSAHEALEHNMTLGVGALAFRDGAYVLRHVVCLDDLSWATLDRALELVAHEAARLRHRPRRDAYTACFTNYAD